MEGIRAGVNDDKAVDSIRNNTNKINLKCTNMNQSISFLGSKAQRSSGTIEAWNGHQETGDSEIQGSRDRRDGVNSSTNDPDLTDDSDCSLLGSRIGFRDVHRNNLGRYFYPSGVLGAVAMPSSQFQTWGV